MNMSPFERRWDFMKRLQSEVLDTPILPDNVQAACEDMLRKLKSLLVKEGSQYFETLIKGSKNIAELRTLYRAELLTLYRLDQNLFTNAIDGAFRSIDCEEYFNKIVMETKNLEDPIIQVDVYHTLARRLTELSEVLIPFQNAVNNLLPKLSSGSQEKTKLDEVKNKIGRFYEQCLRGAVAALQIQSFVDY